MPTNTNPCAHSKTYVRISRKDPLVVGCPFIKRILLLLLIKVNLNSIILYKKVSKKNFYK